MRPTSFRANLRNWRTDMARQTAGAASGVRVIDPATGEIVAELPARAAPNGMTVKSAKPLRKFSGVAGRAHWRCKRRHQSKRKD
jgi:hypothetical protein